MTKNNLPNCWIRPLFCSNQTTPHSFEGVYHGMFDMLLTTCSICSAKLASKPVLNQNNNFLQVFPDSLHGASFGKIHLEKTWVFPWHSECEKPLVFERFSVRKIVLLIDYWLLFLLLSVLFREKLYFRVEKWISSRSSVRGSPCGLYRSIRSLGLQTTVSTLGNAGMFFKIGGIDQILRMVQFSQIFVEI